MIDRQPIVISEGFSGAALAATHAGTLPELRHRPMDRRPPATTSSFGSLDVMERRHEFVDELRPGRSDSPPEVMLGLLLLGTSFVAGFFFGWIIA